MENNIVISLDELVKPIKTTNALGWVESLLLRFQNTEIHKQKLILNKGIIKEIVDELLPLAQYSLHKYPNTTLLIGLDIPFTWDMSSKKLSLDSCHAKKHFKEWNVLALMATITIAYYKKTNWR